MTARILLVDDDEPIRSMLVRILHLAEADLLVQDCGDGQSALELLAQESFQLLIVDYLMPGLSGLEVIRRLREGEGPNRHLPIMMLTARSENHHLVEVLESGANYFLAKPFEPQELLNTVGSALGMRLEF